MKRFLLWIRSWFVVKACQHPNLVERKWLDRDGCPMITVNCPDCGFNNFGHVHTDPETWLDEE